MTLPMPGGIGPAMNHAGNVSNTKMIMVASLFPTTIAMKAANPLVVKVRTTEWFCSVLLRVSGFGIPGHSLPEESENNYAKPGSKYCTSIS